MGRSTKTRYKKGGEHLQGILSQHTTSAQSAIVNTKGREIKRIRSKTKISDKVGELFLLYLNPALLIYGFACVAEWQKAGAQGEEGLAGRHHQYRL